MYKQLTMDEGGFNSTNVTNCKIFDTLNFKIVAIVSATSGLVSFFACLLVIALIFLLKKHLFFTQRIILYLTIAALFSSGAKIARRVDFMTSNSATSGFCVFSGFFDQITSWSLLIAISCITVNLFLSAVLRKRTDKLEKLYLFLIFLFPLTFNWIPFIQIAYGKAGAWCWIRSTDEDCNTLQFGSYLQFILWWVPLYLILFLLIVLYVVIICNIQSSRRKWSGRYDPETDRLKKQMEKEIRPIFWYPIIYLCLNIFPLINRIHDAVSDTPSLPLWILHALFLPLQGGFIAVAFTLDPGTLRRLSWSKLRAALGHKTEVKEYHVEKMPGKSDSFRRGSRQARDGDSLDTAAGLTITIDRTGEADTQT